MVCANDRNHPKEWTLIEESIVEFWRIGGSQALDAYDEMLRKLVALADDIKNNIQQGLDRVQWHNTVKTIIEFRGVKI